MSRSILVIALLFALACGGMGTAPTGPMADMAARFAVFDCSAGSTDLDRSWCPVQAAGHGPFTAPASTEIRMGLTLAVPPGANPRDQVEAFTTLSALYVGPDGAKLMDIQPSNDEEMADLVGVVMSIASTLKGVPDSSVLVKGDLKAYLESQASGLHPMTTNADGATFSGMHTEATIQRIEGTPWGAAYVVVEEASDGAFVSVFPDSDLTVLPL